MEEDNISGREKDITERQVFESMGLLVNQVFAWTNKSVWFCPLGRHYVENFQHHFLPIASENIYIIHSQNNYIHLLLCKSRSLFTRSIVLNN